MFENSIPLENGEALGHKFKGLSHKLFPQSFALAIFQTRSLTLPSALCTNFSQASSYLSAGSFASSLVCLSEVGKFSLQLETLFSRLFCCQLATFSMTWDDLINL